MSQKSNERNNALINGGIPVKLQTITTLFVSICVDYRWWVEEQTELRSVIIEKVCKYWTNVRPDVHKGKF